MTGSVEFRWKNSRGDQTVPGMGDRLSRGRLAIFQDFRLGSGRSLTRCIPLRTTIARFRCCPIPECLRMLSDVLPHHFSHPSRPEALWKCLTFKMKSTPMLAGSSGKLRLNGDHRTRIISEVSANPMRKSVTLKAFEFTVHQRNWMAP